VKPRSWLTKAIVYLVLVALSALFLMPLAWTISTSLKPNRQTMELPPRWWPKDFLWSNYSDAVMYRSEELGYIPMLRQARNTLYLAVLSVTGVVISNALVAYGFARIRWRGREVLFAITLATMMVPFPVTMVAVFSIFKELGWIGSFRPLWIPAWLGSAFNIFLLRQFFMSIPQDLSDAAAIDGCGELQTFWHVILPLAKPALAVVGLFHFMYVWNDFLGPLIYLTDESMFTLSLGLQAYQSQHGGTEWSMLMAASMIVITPLIVLFFLTQRTFIQGVRLTGIKG
jgi:multiple sugar transport system permease protein